VLLTPLARLVTMAAIVVVLFAGFLDADQSLQRPAETAVAPGAEPVETVTVVMRNLRYVPDVVRIRPGTMVVFANEDDRPHNVVHGSSPKVGTQPGLFESPILQPGEEWSFLFTEPGEYSILCTVSAHQLMGMVGTIIVEDIAGRVEDS